MPFFSFFNAIFSFFNNENGLVGLISILMTATILTIFEIYFFYTVIAPDIERTMNKYLNKMSTMIADKLHESIDNLTKTGSPMSRAERLYQDRLTKSYIRSVISNSEAILNTFKTFNLREEKIIDKINTYTVITGGAIILFLVMLMVTLIWQLNGVAQSNSVWGHLFSAFASTLMTVTVLIVFQLYFYLFGQDYNFPGSYGTEELIVLIGSNIKSSI